MLLRPILSRIHKHQRLINFFCILNNGGNTLASSESINSPSKSLDEKPLEKGYVISYLMNSCGLSPEKATSASKKVHFDSPDKPNAVLNFLEKQGFSKIQITEIVTRLPRVLVSKPEKSLSPKIEFLLQLAGISEADILETVSKNPTLLKISLEHRLAPVYDYLKDVIGAEKAATLLRRGSWIFNVDLGSGLIPNVVFLRKFGVPQQFIELALYNFPEIFRSKHVDFREVVEEVKQMGFDPLKSAFVFALHARTGANIALWDQCSEVYGNWGWSKDDIHMAFRKHPNCMLMSEKKISAVMDFLVNQLGRTSRSVASCPSILCYNMEKRTVPRCSVVHLLSLKGLLKQDWSFSSVICPSEKKFLEKYVMRYSEELPQLYEIYLSKKARAVKVHC